MTCPSQPRHEEGCNYTVTESNCSELCGKTGVKNLTYEQIDGTCNFNNKNIFPDTKPCYEQCPSEDYCKKRLNMFSCLNEKGCKWSNGSCGL